MSELSRRELLIFNCNLNALGLEIGPSYNPIAPKVMGYQVDILDHADAVTLREKYKNHNADLSKIEEVDFVWSGEPLNELTGRNNYYEWIIASHVIEHTPDLISFLSQCEMMLKSGGILSLAIPDHRYCFDVFRPVSTSGDVVQAFYEKRTKHSLGAIFDHFSMGAKKNDALGWDKNSIGEYSLIHETVDHAKSVLADKSLTDKYLDIHNWRFTPASFKLIMADILSLGLINLSISEFSPTQGFEFICQLQKNSDNQRTLSEGRRNLLIDIHAGH